MFTKPIIGIITSLISVISYVPYIVDIIKNKTKPHIFSWLVWTILIGIAFFGQIVGKAGSGAWLLGTTTIMSFIVLFLSFKKGTKDIKSIDWICMFGAFLAMFFWLITKTPLLSVITVTLTDAIACIPTIRKSFNKPYQETISFYFLNIIKLSINLFAFEKYSFLTILYPIYLISANTFIVTFLYIRRKQMRK
jgi:hypothetical protein